MLRYSPFVGRLINFGFTKNAERSILSIKASFDCKTAQIWDEKCRKRAREESTDRKRLYSTLIDNVTLRFNARSCLRRSCDFNRPFDSLDIVTSVYLCPSGSANFLLLTKPIHLIPLVDFTLNCRRNWVLSNRKFFSRLFHCPLQPVEATWSSETRPRVKRRLSLSIRVLYSRLRSVPAVL